MQDFRAATPAIAVEAHAVPSVPVARMSDGRRLLRRVLRKRMMVAGVAVRLVDMVLAFPSLILAMAIAAALGPSIQNSMLAMLLVWWPPYARLARGQVLALKSREYVIAARGLGLPEHRILLRHVLPNARAPLV